jgi:DNA invertase Pin-like site-specific DNA recombinase
MEKYIAYYRVSTQKQGKSGLGLEAQKSAVMQFLSENDILLGEYTDIESGKRNNRPNLLEAIAQSKKEEAILLIAKLDRLSRNAAFIFTLRDTHVKFKCVDMPEANSVTIGIMAVLAQDERERISQRTKAALSELKKQGKKLGSPQNLNLAARKKGFQTRIENSRNNENNQKATALIVSLRNQGLTFYRITKRLNALNFKTRRGNQFQQNQVKILFDRYYGDLQEVLKE